MLELSTDPVIQFYESMLMKTQMNNLVPEFSEIYLRLAFKEMFGINYIILPEVLQLYRQLLVLRYCERYPTISTISAIMNRRFNINDINVIIADRNNILNKWREFKNSDI